MKKSSRQKLGESLVSLRIEFSWCGLLGTAAEWTIPHTWPSGCNWCSKVRAFISVWVFKRNRKSNLDLDTAITILLETSEKKEAEKRKKEEEERKRKEDEERKKNEEQKQRDEEERKRKEEPLKKQQEQTFPEEVIQQVFIPTTLWCNKALILFFRWWVQ